MDSPPILYVEDDDNDVFLFRLALDKAGLSHPIFLATDGLCAIEYLSGEGLYANRHLHPLPKLVVVDLKMPRMSGLELLAWIRRQPAYTRMPVVLLSSSHLSSDIHAAFANGANGYVIKPPDSTELIERLKNLLAACQACDFEATGWLPFFGNQPLSSPGREVLPVSSHGPFPGALNVTARYPEN